MLLFWMSTRRTSFLWDLKKWSTDTHDRISLWDFSARARSAPRSVLTCCLRAISSSRCANLQLQYQQTQMESNSIKIVQASSCSLILARSFNSHPARTARPSVGRVPACRLC
jgi:hypothetical protein